MLAIGRYQLLKKLAVGGMSEVWLAREPKRFVALKRVLPHLAGDADFLRMFLSELRIYTRLVHPNIARLYEVGEQHLATELVHGEEVARIERGARKVGRRVGPAIALRIAAEVCRALVYVQALTGERGEPLAIVHRSLDATNIRVAYDGSVKVLDFGLAGVFDRMTSSRAGVLRGKLMSMAPEQAAGKPLDGRTDVFSLGLVLYQLLTGTRAIRGDSDLEMLNAALGCRFEPPSRAGSVPEELDALVMRALARDPADRYPDAAAFLGALEQQPLATPAELAALMRELFPEQKLVIARLANADELLALCYRGGDVVTLENEKTEACWFLNPDDVVGVRGDGVVELQGREMGTQEVGRVTAGPAATAFVETVAAAARCRVRR